MTEKREINLAIIHCSASGPNTTIKDIDRWHKERGWNGIGYHYVIAHDGGIHLGRDINKIGAHAKGHNTGCVGICLVGGHDGKKLHKFSKAQFKSLKILLEGLAMNYPIQVVGHYSLNEHKTCPCFDVSLWLANGKVDYIY